MIVIFLESMENKKKKENNTNNTTIPQRKTSRPTIAANIAHPGCCLVQSMWRDQRQERQETSSLKYFSDSAL